MHLLLARYTCLHGRAAVLAGQDWDFWSVTSCCPIATSANASHAVLPPLIAHPNLHSSMSSEWGDLMSLILGKLPGDPVTRCMQFDQFRLGLVAETPRRDVALSV